MKVNTEQTEFKTYQHLHNAAYKYNVQGITSEGNLHSSSVWCCRLDCKAVCFNPDSHYKDEVWFGAASHIGITFTCCFLPLT